MPSEDTQFKPGHTKSVKHSMDAIDRRGSVALPEALRGRELEVIENLATHQGVLRELEAVALKYVCICEAGGLWLKNRLDAEGNPWGSGKDGIPEPMLSRYATYLAGAARVLGQLAQLRGDRDAIDLPTLLSQEVGDAANAGD